jgi:hypothetical protein
MEMSGQLHAPAALPRGKSSRYPLENRLGELQNRSGRNDEEIKSHHWRYRELNPGLPARSLVTEVIQLTSPSS